MRKEEAKRTGKQSKESRGGMRQQVSGVFALGDRQGNARCSQSHAGAGVPKHRRSQRVSRKARWAGLKGSVEKGSQPFAATGSAGARLSRRKAGNLFQRFL